MRNGPARSIYAFVADGRTVTNEAQRKTETVHMYNSPRRDEWSSQPAPPPLITTTDSAITSIHVSITFIRTD